MGNLAVLLPKGHRVAWGSWTGRVIADVGAEHVWVERDGDHVDCFALRDLLESRDLVVAGVYVKCRWRRKQERGVVHAVFDRSDGVRMAVVEWAGYHTETAEASMLVVA